MYVHKPNALTKNILVTENKSPLSKVIERIPVNSKEEAWQVYRQIKAELKV